MKNYSMVLDYKYMCNFPSQEMVDLTMNLWDLSFMWKEK